MPAPQPDQLGLASKAALPNAGGTRGQDRLAGWEGRVMPGHAGGVEPRLSADQKAELAALVDAGPDLSIDGVIRWRRIDLQRVIKERFGVDYHERYVGTLLRKLGFSHISPRPLHPGQDAQMLETFKKTSPSR